MAKTHLLLLFGGRSGEHEVSLMSAQSVLAALNRSRFEITTVGIRRDGRWTLVDENQRQQVWDQGLDSLPLHPATILPEPGHQGLLDRQSGQELPVDIVFPVLHGPYGEDGTLQGLLEMANLPFVGSRVAGSAVGMDKGLMKAVFDDAGLPIVPYCLVDRRSWQADRQAIEQQLLSELGLPLFVKPANLGSSVGVSKVQDAAGLGQALELAAQHDRRLIVEQAVASARELECSVLGNDELQAAGPGEIFLTHDFYDYEAKYFDETSELIIPADVEPFVARQLRELAMAAFRAVDACGLARVDFLVEGDKVWLNEINTMPGFTHTSMYAKIWEQQGLAYADLCSKLVELAFERHRDYA